MSITTIEEFIENLDKDQKGYIEEFIAFMKTEYPNIIPKISFSMPMWWVGPKMYDGYVGVSPAKKHYSIHFHNEDYISHLKNVLPGCSFGRKCINIKYGDEQAITVVKQSVKNYFNDIL